MEDKQSLASIAGKKEPKKMDIERKGLSRRSFLKVAGIVGAGLALGLKAEGVKASEGESTAIFPLLKFTQSEIQSFKEKVSGEKSETPTIAPTNTPTQNGQLGGLPTAESGSDYWKVMYGSNSDMKVVGAKDTYFSGIHNLAELSQKVKLENAVFVYLPMGDNNYSLALHMKEKVNLDVSINGKKSPFQFNENTLFVYSPETKSVSFLQPKDGLPVIFKVTQDVKNSLAKLASTFNFDNPSDSLALGEIKPDGVLLINLVTNQRAINLTGQNITIDPKEVVYKVKRTVSPELLTYINNKTPEDVKTMEGMNAPDADHPFYWRSTPDGGVDVWAWGMTADNQLESGFVHIQDSVYFADTDTRMTFLSAVNPNPPCRWRWYNGVKFTDLTKQELGKWMKKYFGNRYAHTDIYIENIVNLNFTDSSTNFVSDFGTSMTFKGVDVPAIAVGAEDVLLPNSRKVVILRIYTAKDPALTDPVKQIKDASGSIDESILDALIYDAKRQKPTDRPLKVLWPSGLTHPSPFRLMEWELLYPTEESQRMLTTLTP